MYMSVTSFAAAASITRPNDTTTYASADLVANNTTAGSVTPFSFTLPSGILGRPHLLKTGLMTITGTSVPIANTSFRLHLFTTSPTVANGDNAAFSTTAAYSSWIGALDTTHTALGSAGTRGIFGPVTAGVFPIIPAGTTTLYGLLEARAAYVPVAQSVFAITQLDAYYGF
jgi:hypothetical protein